MYMCECGCVCVPVAVGEVVRCSPTLIIATMITVCCIICIAVYIQSYLGHGHASR